MSCAPLPSDLVRQIRERFSLSLSSGISLTSSDVRNLVNNLRIIEEITKEQEEDLTLYEHEMRRRRATVTIDLIADNVVRFPVALRIVPAPPTGGDAA